MQNLPKHAKYKQHYKPNDLYWGLGVEHETYLETSKLKQVTPNDLKNLNKRERYSVDYLTVYNKDQLYSAIDGLFNDVNVIRVPILMNAHSFLKTDINGEHKTTYERIPKPNPSFNGKTIHEWLIEENPDVFKEDYDKTYLFDGDTIEFVTQNYYKTTVMDVIHEITTIEKDFIRALNSLPREGIFRTYAPFKIAEKNYGFAAYLTNLKNNAMFNNGTIHINITLPTKLNSKSEIEDFDAFKKKHQKYARAIQWLSPLIIAKYGAHDPLSESPINGELYAAGSQRVAVSRYIGLGTYDTDEMEIGKVLTKQRVSLKDIDWYDAYSKKCGYIFPDEIGMDINFNKHHSHGIEFRILESIPLYELQEIITTLVYLADFSLKHDISNPKKNSLWHKIALNSVHDGKGYLIDVSDQNDLFELFNINYISKEPLPAYEVYDIIALSLSEQYKDSECSRALLLGIGPDIKYNPDHIYKFDNVGNDSNSVIVAPPSSPESQTSDISLGSFILEDNERPRLETITEVNSVISEDSVSTSGFMLTTKTSLLCMNPNNDEGPKGELKAPEGELKEVKGELKEVKGELKEAKGELKEAKGELKEAKEGPDEVPLKPNKIRWCC